MKMEPINKSRLPIWKRIWKDYGQILWCVPVLMGIVIFTLIPMITSLVYSFYDYNYYNAENQFTNPGFQNYIKMFTTDFKAVTHSLWITFRYSFVSVLLGVVGSYAVALFMNQKTKGIYAFRIIYYIPTLIPAVASTLLWKNLTNADTGYLNLILAKLGLPTYTFYDRADTVFATQIMLSVFGWSGGMIMWLAQMKNIPDHYYEAAELDGAGYFVKLIHITIPMTTSMLFYQLITNLISSLQAFGGVYPLLNGKNNNELDFIVVKIYNTAFTQGMDMGYACALSWLLFVIIGLLTVIIFRTSKWVYYGEDN